jgi:tRNA(His) guanylyltransferase
MASLYVHSSTNVNVSFSKITSTVVSLFASNYAMHWSEYFPDRKLMVAPCFDARLVCYPTKKVLRDYLCWRQADCKYIHSVDNDFKMCSLTKYMLGHINNLYNTTFWAIVHSGKSEQEAEERLRVCWILIWKRPERILY